MTKTRPALTIGVSTKMYFSYARTIEYAEAMAGLASHPAVAAATVELFLIPSYPTLAEVARVLAGTPVRIGAQDVATHDSGAFTGEVSAPMLAEIGCTLAEVGHAERRRLFGETEDVTRAKTQAALRNGITPVLCLGEGVFVGAPDAAAEVIRQLDSALQGSRRGSAVIVAYEPHWAIGAAEPAPTDHIAAVCLAVREHLAADERIDDGRVIYGGSAGPGLLASLGNRVDGLFLGRFAHDPGALTTIIDEAAFMQNAM